MYFDVRTSVVGICVVASSVAPLAATTVTPGSVAETVRRANPDLAAARLRIREAAGRARQSGRLANPELELSFQHDPRFRAGEVEIGFAQRFPVTQRLKLERKVSATLLKAAEAEVAEVERGIVAQARERVMDLLLLRQRRELLKEQARISGELADRLAEAGKRGETSGLDVGQARLEAATLSIDLRSLDLRETALLGELKPLLGVTPGKALTVGGALPAARLPGRKGESLEARPDYQVAQLQAVAAREGRALEHSRRYEDIQAGVFSTLERTPEQDNDGFLGFRLSLPLPIWNRNEGAIEEAAARQERSEREVDALGSRIRSEADAAYAAMKQSLASLHQLDTELLPMAKEQEKAVTEAWGAGLTDLNTYFRVQNYHQTLALSRLDALREFHLARLRYEAALGH